MSMTRTVYSEKLKEALAELRPAFKDVGQSLAALTQKRRDLAPQFHKTWLLWRRETRRTQIAFIQALDPSVPADRKLYRDHPSVRAAQYMLQLVENPDQKKRKGLTPLSMLAVTIKSFLPLCGSQKDQKDALQVLIAATRWREADQSKLLTAIRRAKPVALPKVPRLVEAAKAAKAVVLAFEREREQDAIARSA